MKQRVITGIIFFIVMLAILVPAYWYPIISLGLALLIGAVSLHELIKAMKHGGFKPSVPLIVVGFLLMPLMIVLGKFLIKDLFITTTLYGCLSLMFALATAILPQTFDPDKKLKDSLYSVLSFLYVSFPLYCLCATALFFEHGWFYLIVGIASSWVSDTLAYFTGVLLGKHKIVPHISPKKTWEGCIGGAVFTGIFMVLYFGLIVYDIHPVNLGRVPFMLLMFFFGILISAMSQIGDWLASSIKRAVDIKDYGNFMPGHGGMLDRFDSVFFTLPIAFIMAIVSIYI